MSGPRIWKIALLSLALLYSTPAIAAAQTIVNPTRIAFDHEDYALTDSYVLGYFSSATAPAPVQEGALTKPTSCAPCVGPLVSRPTTFGTWYVGVRAVAGAVTSEWSALIPFARAPLAPVIRSVS
jgi:hypothetical protein